MASLIVAHRQLDRTSWQVGMLAINWRIILAHRILASSRAAFLKLPFVCLNNMLCRLGIGRQCWGASAPSRALSTIQYPQGGVMDRLREATGSGGTFLSRGRFHLLRF